MINLVDEDKIKYETDLLLSLVNQTTKGKNLVKEIANNLGKKDIWVIRTWGTFFNLGELVEFLFKHDLDVFDIDIDTITKIYVCKKDDYRIQNSVVFNIRNWK